MSYLLKKLKEWEGLSPEELKNNLYREGFVDYNIDLKYEIYTFYCDRLSYYKRIKISAPKMEALYQTKKQYGISHDTIYSIIGHFR